MAPYLEGELIDPSTQKTEPVYPLSIEGLDKLFEYRSHEGGLSNGVVSQVDLPAGAHFCYITQHKPAAKPDWSTVQAGKHTHIDLQSGLVYTNHSCRPSLEFQMFSPDANGKYPQTLPYELPEGQPAPVPGKHGIAGEVRVAHDRAIKKGEDLTFFYPSTEWKSVKPFDCLCNAGEGICVKNAAGSSYLSKEQLSRYFLADHIKELLKERDAQQ
ncbi:hypothetical protein AMS68_003434 [Peltaster fructicola]|uniref:SET domain-containing protein n=1 Tax=Peltaster fructicola TaxID=286661 RepID=A0A6H0XT27_9PEZI|nr:hypothetical protein AMS68_003434 [Peltaster fructicola]